MLNNPRTSEEFRGVFAEGGEFVQVFEGQPPILTPYRYADVYGRYVNDEIIEALGRYGPNTLELEHVLAEAWQMDPQGMWLRVKLRENARFSDGVPVTAEDVRWTHDDFLFNPEIQADRFRSVYNAIAKIEVLSDKVLEFTFKEPRFDNMQQAVLMPIVPKHFYSRFTPSQINQSTGLVMGSGPFRLERLDPTNQWTPPNDIVLVRNENYWGEKPALARVRFKVVQDSLARMTTFTNGEADMVRPTAPQFDLKRNDPEFTRRAQALEWYNVQGGWSFIAWQCGPRAGVRLTPFADRRVRLAMTHLIDRERIRRDISKNLARIATGPFNSETPQANPAIDPWPHNEARAMELLAEAGWKDRNGDGVLENEQGDRFTFQLTFGQGNDSTLQMVTYVKDQCAKVGIICELNPIDWSVLQSILDRRDFDAATFAWSSSAPETDPTQLWAISSIEGTGDNFVQWRSEKADELIKRGRRMIDDAERMKVWHELHSVIHEEQPYTPLMEVPWLRFLDNRVQNMRTYRMGMEIPEFFIPAGAQKMP
jgi:peptide/nickel transport system substrate-binding protein